MAAMIIEAKHALGRPSRKLESQSITVSKIPLDITVTSFKITND